MDNLAHIFKDILNGMIKINQRDNDCVGVYQDFKNKGLKLIDAAFTSDGLAGRYEKNGKFYKIHITPEKS